MDSLTPEQRTKNMKSIKSKDTRIEIVVRKRLFAEGYRFRKNDKRYPGTPDIVLPKYHTMIFINGCFWHGHPGCKHFVVPKTNTDYWLNKINRNIASDQKNYLKLKCDGWKIVILWECELKPVNIEVTIDRLIHLIHDDREHNN